MLDFIFNLPILDGKELLILKVYGLFVTGNSQNRKKNVVVPS